MLAPPESGSPRSRERTALPDAEGLVAALVLAPATYSRNRFFELYRVHTMRRARGRAAKLRGLLRHVLLQRGFELTEVRDHEDGSRTLRYALPLVNARVTVHLTSFEVAVLAVAVARARGESPEPVALARVDSALLRLAPLGTGSAPAEAQGS
jgi:hypothetical protein